MSDRERQAFLNQMTGTFTPDSQEWVISADQWSQTYYQLRDGKLYFVENDNKEQTYNETEVDIPAFINQHQHSSSGTHADIAAALSVLVRK